MRKHYGCPVQATANALTGKWKVMIVWQLSFQPRRFRELKDLLPGISEKVLMSQLKELMRDGIVRREETPGTVMRVDYRLSAAGEELIPIMESMCEWGTEHLGVLPNLPRRMVAMSSAVKDGASGVAVDSGQGG